MSANGNGRVRANGEGSIYPYKNGYAAYAWVTTPTGEKKRKYLYGQTREEVYGKWVQLKAAAAKVPIPTSTPTVAEYLAQAWLNRIPGNCQCCAQGKDAKRKQPRCCAAGACCEDYPSRRVIEGARNTPRAALNNAFARDGSLMVLTVAGLGRAATRSARE
jgi:hypothetical protein